MKNSRGSDTSGPAGNSSCSVIARPEPAQASSRARGWGQALCAELVGAAPAWELLLEVPLPTSSPFASEHGAGLGCEPLIPAVRSGTLHTRCSNKTDLVQG